eukprot:m51a1_g3879 putative calcium-transporting p-type TPase (907) ;mRNA; f:32706-36032
MSSKKRDEDTPTPSPKPGNGNGGASTRPGADVVEFYTHDVAHALHQARARPDGLSDAEAEARLRAEGPNEIAPEEEESLLRQYLDKYTDATILMLLASAGISLVMRQFEDAMSIVLAVVIVSTVGFIQEYKSEKAVEALKQFIALRCVVVREGHAKEIAANELVVGDVVRLFQGGSVPADVRLIETVNLTINESLLTGEPEPVGKHTNPIAEDKGFNLADRKNMACMGTSVATGTGLGVVTATGDNTELGKISAMLVREEKKTPLQHSMDQFGKTLSIVSIVAIVLISVVGLLQGKPAIQMFNMAVSLAVAAIPEGLPIAVTVTLALGVTRMSRRNAIVRKLPAVETLGATNVICVDKTGTLTQNQMTVARLFTTRSLEVHHQKESLVDGSVEFRAGNELVTPQKDKHLQELLRACSLCNNASITADALVGQPTEGGLLSVAHKAGLPDYRKQCRRVNEIPFDSISKWMGVQCVVEGGRELFFVKGGTEVVLQKCAGAYAGPLDPAATIATADAMAAESLRVMAVAYGESTDKLTFLGLVGLYDPPRRGVAESIRLVRGSGVHVVMITGDARTTALAVARQLGLADGRDLSAAEVDSMSEAELSEVALQTTVFYRMTPGHKMKIVAAYKAAGKVVAMTGDGVNDAPALSKSDIGIAMGRGGSDVCKEAAEIILVDNNFSTIAAAIEEGKVIFTNIKNFLHFQLTTSVAAMGLTAVCSLADLPLPLNPTQILWINIIMDGPPAQSLTFESFRDAARAPPRRTKDPIVDRRTVAKIVLSAAIMVAGTMFVFLKDMPNESLEGLHKMNDTPKHASTMAFTTFVLFQLFNSLNCRSLYKSVFKVGLFSNTYLLLSVLGSLLTQMLVVYLPFLGMIFRTTPLTAQQLGWCFAVSSLVWLADEVWKALMFFN